jgi:hypothetical protein
MTRQLRNILAIYTITFTLFLIPMPQMELLETAVIGLTSLIGWMLLYLDTIIMFIRDPQSQYAAFMKEMKLGFVNYTSERLKTYHHIRRINAPHTAIRFPPNNKLNPPRGMDAWWKSDILRNLKKHSLQDYFDPADFAFEKYSDKFRPVASRPVTQSPISSKGRTMERHSHHKDDIFSSDEDLDTSPLGNIPMTKHRRATIPNMYTPFSNMKSIPAHMQTSTPNAQVGNISAESKQTVVDDAMSPREKVSGFIAWDALKPEEPAALGRRNSNASVDAQRAFARMTKTETEGSDESSLNSWEKEALGAGI